MLSFFAKILFVAAAAATAAADADAASAGAAAPARRQIGHASVRCLKFGWRH